MAGPHSTLNKKPIAINSTSNQTTTVTCKTLDSILQDNNVPIGFEFISIDIEGHEMEMFKGFSLKKWQPQLILLKDHLINHKKHSYMKINNSQLILRTGLNSWYIPQSQKYKFSMSSKLEIFRKYWLGLLTREIKYKK